MEYSLFILIAPFFLFLVLGLLGMKMKPKVAGIIGTVGMGLCAICAYAVAYQYFFQAGKVGEAWQQPFAHLHQPAIRQKRRCAKKAGILSSQKVSRFFSGPTALNSEVKIPPKKKFVQ